MTLSLEALAISSMLIPSYFPRLRSRLFGCALVLPPEHCGGKAYTLHGHVSSGPKNRPAPFKAGPVFQICPSDRLRWRVVGFALRSEIWSP